MAHLRVQVMGEGQHPTERVISIRTASGGAETVYVDEGSIENGTVDVGEPVGHDRDRKLVELPRETMSGSWRIWVSAADVLEGVPA